MNLPAHILVPTDFSDNATQALDYAVALAAKLDATVHVLNVIGAQMLGIELGVALTSSMVDSMLEGDQQELDRLVAARAGRAKFGPTVLKFGDARDSILATAAEVGADLVVMGTHGRSGLTRLVIGSVAEAVVRMAPCPVLLVRASA